MNSDLNILFKLLNDPSINDKDKIIDQIDTALNNITAANFDLYGKNIVIYGDILYANAYGENKRIQNQKYYAKLLNLYTRLRAIGKLGVDRDITIFIENMDEIISIAHSTGKYKGVTHRGSFWYYFFANRVNRHIANGKSFIGPLILFLIPEFIDIIENQNLKRAIILAIQGFDEPSVQSFMNYFYVNKRIDILNLFMQYALQYGRCNTVEWLLNKNISLPSELESVVFCLQVANKIKNMKVIQAISDKFPVDDVLDYCIRKRLYEFAKDFFPCLGIGDITFQGIKLITELAAACGDIAALKLFLEKCIPSKREALFRDHILPFYVPATLSETADKEIDLQKLFNQKFAKMVAMISFYMRNEKFIFSLEKATDDSFTLVNCGELRKLIAYSHREDKHYAFGVIRFTCLTTPLYGTLEEYGKKTNEIVEKQGKLTRNKYLLRLNKVKDHYIYAQLPKGPVKYTIFRMPSSSNGEDKIHTLWKHTQPKHFPAIVDVNRDLWLQFNRIRKMQDSINWLVVALRSLAKIHYYIAPPCFYKRGSATVAEAIIAAACLTIELDDLRKYQQKRPDCEAIMSASCEEFVKNYPQFYGFKNYEEMVTALHEAYIRRMSRKENELNIIKAFIAKDCKTLSDSSSKIIEHVTKANEDQKPTHVPVCKNPTKITIQCSQVNKLVSVGNKQNSILYPDLNKLSDVNVERAYYGNTFEDLMKELIENGPVIVKGYYGQAFYTHDTKPFTHNFNSIAIAVNGWPPNSYKENKSLDQQKIIVIGAKKEGDTKLIYYLLAADQDKSKIFVISHLRFIQSRGNIFEHEAHNTTTEVKVDKNITAIRMT